MQTADTWMPEKETMGARAQKIREAQAQGLRKEQRLHGRTPEPLVLEA